MDKCPKCGRDKKYCDWEMMYQDAYGNSCRIRELEAEVQRLRSQLPEGMQDCTIRFKSCPLGHGWLTADNWVQHGCPTCERNNLREAGRLLAHSLHFINCRCDSGCQRCDEIVIARRRWQEVDPR